ncbi:MAG: response regulator transcription factor [Pseudomonadales bacterium]
MQEEGPVPVMIVEDDPVTRDDWADKVRDDPGLRLAAVCAGFEEASTVLDVTDARVALIDLGLPDGDGTDLIRFAVARDPPIEVMVMTVFGDERHVVRAIEAGATGYLLKDADAPSVSKAIHDLLAGGSPISTAIARHLLRRFRVPEAAGETVEPAVSLTPREREVLDLVARGCSNAEIGDLLQLSFHTVNSHIKNIYRKLAVRSRSEAVFEAVQQGLIQIDRSFGRNGEG